MNCKHLKIKLNRQLECKKKGEIINIKNCSCCKYKEYKNTQPLTKMSNKSAKIRKLEKNRFSVFTKDLKHCVVCGNKKDHLHEIFPGKNRLISMNYGFVIPLCYECHSEIHHNLILRAFWQKNAQLYFEENIGSREEFIKVFGKNYIND